jgi:hypothetical protein
MREIVQDLIHLLLHGSNWNFYYEKINGIWYNVHKCKVSGCKATRLFKE